MSDHFKIQAIQTTYQGYKFRSRLEARWAVFFDALGLKWEYEPEGFQLPGGLQYLPDFRVTSPTGLVQWYEIKPAGGSSLKFDAFSEALHTSHKLNPEARPVHAQLLAANDPLSWLDANGQGDSHSAQSPVCPRCGAFSDHLDKDLVWPDMHIYCYACDCDTADGGGHPVEQGVLGPVWPHKGSVAMAFAAWQACAWRVREAALDARAARFEHGESGRPT